MLIVTCPCALSLAAPSAYLAAAAALLRRGVLVQRLDALEALRGARHRLLRQDRHADRRPGPQRVALNPPAAQRRPRRAGVRAMAAALAAASNHPLSVALAAQARGTDAVRRIRLA